MTKGLMIVEVFVTETEPEDPLSQHGPDRMNNLFRNSRIIKTLCGRLQQSASLLNFIQEKNSPIRSDAASFKVNFDLSVLWAFQFWQTDHTSCSEVTGLDYAMKPLSNSGDPVISSTHS